MTGRNKPLYGSAYAGNRNVDKAQLVDEYCERFELLLSEPSPRQADR